MKAVSTSGVVLILAMFLLAACAPKATPAPPAPAPAAASAPAPAAVVAPVTPAKPAWEVEWEKTVQAAKKEDTVVITTPSGPRIRRDLSEVFKSRFGMNIEWIAGTSADVSVRTVNERRAGIHSVDICISGSAASFEILVPVGAFENLEPVLLLPELTDPRQIQEVWRFRQLEWIDKAHTMLIFNVMVNYGIVVNTSLVKPGEIKAFRDLLNPKWKGAIIMYDVTMGSGPGSTWVQVVGTKIMDWDYLRKLAEQQPVITRDARLQVDWLAHGKYAIGLAARSELVEEFKDIGAPIQGLMAEEGAHVSEGASVLSLIKDAPHPNAARLFINWLLSKEGQTVYAKAAGAPSLRLDASTEGINPLKIPDPKKQYAKAFAEETLRTRPEAVKKAQEIFGPLKK